MLLMLKDTPVLQVDFGNLIFKQLEPDLLPINLKDKLERKAPAIHDADYIANSQFTMRQAAQYARKRVEIHYYEDFTKEDFLTERQYQSFMSRLKNLTLKKSEKPEYKIKNIILLYRTYLRYIHITLIYIF